MHTVLTVLVVIAVIALIVLALLWHFGKKVQANQVESQKLIEQTSQVVSILVIDKKKMRITEAPLPKQLVQSTPFYARIAKVGIVKAKIGPKVFNLVTDANLYRLLPVKSECKVKLSGLYITDIVKGAAPDEKLIKKRQKAKEKAAKKAEKENKKKS